MLKCNNHKQKDRFKLPDAIFIDMDNTIYEYHRCHNKALKQIEIFLKNKIKMHPRIFREGYESARKQIHSRLGSTASSHSRLLYFQNLLEQSGHASSVGLALKMNNIYWKTYIDNIRIFDEVVQFLEYAKKLKVPVGLITDLTSDVQFRKIQHMQLENKISILVTSEEVGRDKPGIAIFELALKKLGFVPRVLWMIGDGYHQDVLGGRTIGAVTFQKLNKVNTTSTAENSKADFEFDSFFSLIDFLKEIRKK